MLEVGIFLCHSQLLSDMLLPSLLGKMERQNEEQLRIWVNVGEASGDVYGEHLMRELKKLVPDCRFQGMGGARMRAAGLETVGRAEELSIMGLTEALSHLPRIVRLLGRLREAMRVFRPHVVVVVDCPDFHFRLVRMAGKLRVPVVYYVAPQAWAWRKNRVKFLRCFVDRLLCILPFEKQFFQAHGVAAEYVGHPLLNEIDFEALRDLQPDQKVIGILPGSRKQEVSALLPVFAQAAQKIFCAYPDICFHLMLAPNIEQELLERIWPGDIPLTVFPAENRHVGIRQCAFVMASSGTATLECALLGTPTMVAYQFSGLTYFLGRLLVDVPYIALPNLVLNEMVFPEFLQQNANGEKLGRQGLEWLEQAEQLTAIREKLADLQKLFGQKSAAACVAEIVLEQAGAQKETK